MTTPYNPAAHEHLLAAGYTHQHIDAEWEDTGDAENGPELSGHPAYDLYTDADSEVYVGEHGDTEFEWRDLEMEAHIAAMEGNGRADQIDGYDRDDLGESPDW